MRNRSFDNYLQEFTVLALEAGVLEEDYNDDLYDDMSNRLKEANMSYSHNKALTFQEFVVRTNSKQQIGFLKNTKHGDSDRGSGCE